MPMPLHAWSLPAGLCPVDVTPAVSYVIADGRVHARFHGDVTVEDVFQYLKTLWVDPDYLTTSSALVDVRDMTSIPTLTELRAVIAVVTAHARGGRGTGRRAIVAGRSNGYRALCMFEVLARDLPVGHRIFVDPDEARQWLDAGTRGVSCSIPSAAGSRRPNRSRP